MTVTTSIEDRQNGSLTVGRFIDERISSGAGPLPMAAIHTSPRFLPGGEDCLSKTLEELRSAHAELRATYARLREAMRLGSVGRLAVGVAHEVRNALQTALAGLPDLDRSLTSADEQVISGLKAIQEALCRADATVGDLMALSAERALHTTLEDVSALVTESLRLVTFELKKTHIAVRRELAAGLPRLRLDRSKTQEALVHLFLNAIQSMPHGGELVARSRVGTIPLPRAENRQSYSPFLPGEEVVVLEILDTGIGMSPDVVSRAFEAFFTTQRAGQGRGLGLPIARQIIEAQGGNIELESTPGRGTTVRLTFGV